MTNTCADLVAATLDVLDAANAACGAVKSWPQLHALARITRAAEKAHGLANALHAAQARGA